MKQIPTEIFNEIFSRLHQSDQVACMCVCKQWRRIVEQQSMYHTVCLGSSNSLDKLTAKIQDNPVISHKINDIIIFYGGSANNTNFFSLLSSLKDVRRLYLSVDAFDDEPNNLQIDCQFYKSIQYISECSSYSLAQEIISKRICPMLTTLKVYKYSDRILPLLGNAPALKRLSLWPTYISFSDLNNMHTSLTSLESLEVEHAGIDNTGFNDLIEPATSVVECNFDRIRINKAKNMLEYIYRKYPNLSNLSCYFSNGASDTQLVDGWIQLFQNLGNQLKRLGHFEEAYDRDLFKTLDEHRCRLNYLHIVHFTQTFIQKIAKSNQALCLQTLVLKDVKIKSLDWLQHLQVLEKFKLSRAIPPRFKSTSIISLNEILRNCPPKLISLSFEFVDIADDFKPSTPCNVKRLSFWCFHLPDGIDTYISHHFPALTKLKLTLCDKIQMKFDLSTLDLHAFHTNYSDILISTLKVDEKRLYKCRPVGSDEPDKWFRTALQHPTSYPVHEIDVVPPLTLICHSLGKIVSK